MLKIKDILKEIELYAPLPLQETLFGRQARLADEAGKPMVIHLVKAVDELLRLRRRFVPRVPWVIHGFRGKAPLAQELLRHGFYLSFGERYRADALRTIPAGRLFAETDESALPIGLIAENLARDRGDDPDELARIISRSAGILDQPITPEGALELAKRSRGTPRVANRFLKRVRDFATVLGDGVIDRDVCLMALRRMDVDALGLDELDRSLLRAIIEMYGGGPVGLETLAAALGEEAVTLEDLCEPYLMQMGFLTRTPRGRCVTHLAYEHLGMRPPESDDGADSGQQTMF